ncbi:hypothetical protein K493DRAFT_405414 [Basidiobolus meristosporus CBS 931.73]|uniref:FAD-binding domain-containing protein n=1 Tax=Basidiobolus meristosporus CBS 931.73 TaxID=1314790 RepID=A0A1Y1YVD8_9FUNG|nr:hypothetical protein K493DRAFT_405414 [Basidiobolus meristosporus CBS 931.73]|eukprot:ORY01936.1 hypothetical protein K493DRAFT_405414 [Basidiobolus meristosporus CBS 931.73]
MLDSFLQKGRPLSSYALRHKGMEFASLPAFSSDTPFPFSLLLSEVEVAKCLEQELVKKTQQGSIVEYSTTLIKYSESYNRVRAFLQHEKNGCEIIECQYIIGCDGIDSVVRTGLHNDWDFEAFSSIGLWVLGDVTIDSPDIDDEEVTIFLHEEGLLTFYPFQSHNHRFRIVANLQDMNYRKVMLSDPKIPIGKTLSTSSEKSINLEFNRLTLIELQNLIQERVTVGKVTVETTTWTSYFSPLEGKATGFRRGRAFLCGDAAHSHSPISGFGHDLGIQDAHNLAWKLFLVLTGRASNSDLFLDSYSAEREPVAVAAIQKTIGVSRIKLLGQLINSEVLQTNPSYSQSPIIEYPLEHKEGMGRYLEANTAWKRYLHPVFETDREDQLLSSPSDVDAEYRAEKKPFFCGFVKESQPLLTKQDMHKSIGLENPEDVHRGDNTQKLD